MRYKKLETLASHRLQLIDTYVLADRGFERIRVASIDETDFGRGDGVDEGRDQFPDDLKGVRCVAHERLVQSLGVHAREYIERLTRDCQRRGVPKAIVSEIHHPDPFLLTGWHGGTRLFQLIDDVLHARRIVWVFFTLGLDGDDNWPVLRVESEWQSGMIMIEGV